MTTRADMLRNPSTYTVAMALIQRCLARRAIPAAKATTKARIAEKNVTSRVILSPEKRASARVITSDIGILLTTRRARMLYLMLVIEPGRQALRLTHLCSGYLVRSGHRHTGEAKRLDELYQLAALLHCGQLLVELRDQGSLRLTEAIPPGGELFLTANDGDERLRYFEVPVASRLDQVLQRDGGQRKSVDAARGQRLDAGWAIGKVLDTGRGHPGLRQPRAFHRPAFGSHDRLGVGQALIIGEVMRVARLDRKGFSRKVIRIGEEDGVATLRRDEHPGSDYVEPVGRQPRYQGTKLG